MERVKVVAGDITKLEVEAIVNAANERMLGGGGVDGAVHRAAGYRLLEACRRVPEVRPGVRCPTGSARITEAFDLPARHIIHTVGPIWQGGHENEDDLLASCYREVFRLLRTHRLRSVAFPAISCGVYRYPPARAASIAADEVFGQLAQSPLVAEVLLVGFQREMVQAMQEAVDLRRGSA